MADLQQSDNKKGSRRITRRNPRVDLTPMVDLAFLLITFFMLVTNLNTPYRMEIAMPAKSPKPVAINPDKCMTILLGSEDRMWYYMGDNLQSMQPTNFQKGGIRDILYAKQKEVRQKFGETTNLQCFIKMTDDANFQNMVSILDEMNITDMIYPSIQDMYPEEKTEIEKQK